MKLNETFWAAFYKENGQLGSCPESYFIGSSKNMVIGEIECWKGVIGAKLEDFNITQVQLVEVKP